MYLDWPESCKPASPRRSSELSLACEGYTIWTIRNYNHNYNFSFSWFCRIYVSVTVAKLEFFVITRFSLFGALALEKHEHDTSFDQAEEGLDRAQH